MKVFEHSLTVTGLSLEEAWRSLEILLRNPGMFLTGCDSVSVSEGAEIDGSRWIHRTKVFGGVQITDAVMLQAPARAEIHVSAGENWPRSWQTIALEPAEGEVKFSFTYEQETYTPSENPAFDKLRFEAYRSKDRALADLIQQRTGL